MKRLSLILVAWLVIFLGVAHGVPARPRHEPKAPTINLVNTNWIGTLYCDGSKLTFQPYGVLRYGDSDCASFGTWTLQGNQLSFEINHYSQYQTVVQGDVISGRGWNKDGTTCQPLLKRVR